MIAAYILANTVAAVGPYGHTMGGGLDLLPPPSGPSESLSNPCPGDTTIPGIDVSYYQGDIDWNAVKSDGIVFAFIRVSDGTGFFDPKFDTNWQQARAAGVYAGVYQYFEPAQDPIAQADLLLNSMGPLMEGDLPPVIDVEATGGLGSSAVGDAVQAWVSHVEDALGVPPIIYTGGYFWQDNVGSNAFADYPLWVAHYGTTCPNVPSPWTDFQFHQYSDSGQVSGINTGSTDMDIFNGSLDELLALGSDTMYVCGTLGPDGGDIEEVDDCFSRYGNEMYWRNESAGSGGSLIWTNATEYADPSNYGVWTIWVEETGDYELSVDVTQPYAETTQATYQISHADGDDQVVVDQSMADGFVSLGQFTFETGVKYTVRLDDNTGEANMDELGIVFDALRVTRAGSGGSDGGGTGTGDGGGDSSLDSGTGGGTEGLPSDGGGAGTGGGNPGDGGGSSSGLGPALPPSEACADSSKCGGACACTSDAPPQPLWALPILFALPRRRRRRSA